MDDHASSTLGSLRTYRNQRLLYWERRRLVFLGLLCVPTALVLLSSEIIGAAVSADHQVELLDMELDTDLAGTLQRFQPDIVGASAQIVQTYSARRVLKTVKQFNPTSSSYWAEFWR